MTTIEDIIRIAVNAHDGQTFPSKEKQPGATVIRFFYVNLQYGYK